MTRYQKLILVRQAERMFPFIKRFKSKAAKLVFVALAAPAALFYLPWAQKRPVVPYLELVVTERCSLKCKSCANLMQYYAHPQHIPLDTVRAELSALLPKLSTIWVLQLLGGEPFLYADLPALLGELTAEKKIKRIQVVTNGTLLPKPEVLRAMAHRKVVVLISNYGPNSRKLDTLPGVLSGAGVAYQLLNYSEWMDYGGLEARHLSPETLVQSFRECAAAECKTLLGGRMYACPRSAHMARLGLLPLERDSLAIQGGDGDFKARLLRFYNVKTIAACDHCNPVWDRRPIPPGEQVAPGTPCLPVSRGPEAT